MWRVYWRLKLPEINDEYLKALTTRTKSDLISVVIEHFWTIISHTVCLSQWLTEAVTCFYLMKYWIQNNINVWGGWGEERLISSLQPLITCLYIDKTGWSVICCTVCFCVWSVSTESILESQCALFKDNLKNNYQCNRKCLIFSLFELFINILFDI